MEDKPDDVLHEYGSISPIRFCDASMVTMYESDNKVMLCKCGVPAEIAVYGKESYIARCYKCMYGEGDGVA